MADPLVERISDFKACGWGGDKFISAGIPSPLGERVRVRVRGT
jgi:hypothetical protein